MSQGLCPSCGAAVSLTAGQTETKCQYCDCVATLQQAEAQLSEVKNSKAGGALLIAKISLDHYDYAKAFTFYEKAIEQDEKCAEAWFGRGLCLANTEDPDLLASGIRRIEGHKAISSWEMAVQFAANPEAMGRRAAQAVANVVSCGLDLEDKLEKQGIRKPRPRNKTYNDSDFDILLSWALPRDPHDEFLLKTGAEFYSRATPYAELMAEASKSQQDAENARLRKAEHEKYLSALRQINPEAAGTCDATAKEARSAAVSQLEKKKELSELYTIDPKLTEWVDRELDREFKKADNRLNGKKEGCFVATACYGEYDHPNVIELRRFRDDFLEPSGAGRAFVRWYYNWSPPFANLVAKSRILKSIVRISIISPAVTIARFVGKEPDK
jgi:hypothetical protein